MSKKVCWGIIGAGAIANAFADGVVRSETGKLVAVGSRSLEKAEAFAEKWGVARAHGSYEALLADESVQAVYIATPHPMHPEWAIKAAEAGKHILLEKPMAINSYLAETILEAVVENNVFFMEAYMYRCHPQTAKLVELIREKAIGDVNAMEASFTFRSEYSPNSRLWNNDLAGGGILDVGGYATSITRLVAGAAVGKPFADPVTVCGVGKLHEERGVDCWAVGAMKFDNGIVGTIRTGIGLAADNSFRVFGSEGSIVVPDPFAASRQGSQNGRIIVRKNGAPEQIIEIPSELTSYVYEADVCGRAILAKRTEAEAPAMTWEDSLGNLRAQDQWRAAIGLTYESEKTKSLGSLTPANRPLALNRNAPAPDMMLPGLDKPMSRLVFGVDNQSTMVHASAVFDDYFMRGGNVFDTAFVYGFKRSHLLGQWIKARGVEDKVVVIAKGAHTPYCNPEDLE
ncbi:MAG: Gfo/Idh/MocA family oxidoreductase, partial [Lentisphaerae bacterium]|nr:Gfo/Idh/MocA family oxidoreductase [Lentisphaerota bacterium]